MLPLLLFLVGCGVVYVATIESAFGAMVRLPERLNVERDIQHGSLTIYLEDPLRLYVATRLLRGLLFASAAVVLARLIGVSTPQAVGLLLLALVTFVLVCEQLVPSVLVRRDAGRVLELLLPSFDRTLRVLGPVTGGLLRLAHRPRRSEMRANRNGKPDEAEASESTDPEATIEDTEERKLLQSVVDFGGTLVVEVMTEATATARIVTLHLDVRRAAGDLGAGTGQQPDRPLCGGLRRLGRNGAPDTGP